MAIINLVTLRLSGINVANAGVVAGQLRKGSNDATGQTPTTFLSFTRHPSYPSLETDSRLGDTLPEPLGMNHPGKRAGRLGCLAGVLSCRILTPRVGDMLGKACLWSCQAISALILANTARNERRNKRLASKCPTATASLFQGQKTWLQASSQRIWARLQMATA